MVSYHLTLYTICRTHGFSLSLVTVLCISVLAISSEVYIIIINVRVVHTDRSRKFREFRKEIEGHC